MLPDAYPHTYTHTHKWKTYMTSFSRRSSRQIQSFSPTHLSMLSLSLNAFGVLNDWLEVFRGYGYWCIRDTSVSETWMCVWGWVCACVSASVKTKRQFSEYFIPVHWLYPLLHHNTDHWNMQECTQRQTNTNINTHTHTCSVSRRSCRLRGSRLQRFRAGATTVQTHLPSGSEAVLYTCQPSSEPGYIPCTQTGSALIKSPHEHNMSWQRRRSAAWISA